MGNELDGLFSFVSGVLKNDATLIALVASTRIQRAPAILPKDTEQQPYVTFDHLSGEDRNFMTTRAQTDVIFAVKGVTTSRNASVASQIADAIDNALVDRQGDLPEYGVTVGPIWRVGLLYINHPIGDVNFLNWGGRYRTLLSTL